MLYPYFFFFFLLRISLTDTNDSQDSSERGVNHYFCVPLPSAHEYAFNSSRFLPLCFNRSIYNYWTDSWWDLLSLEICILLGFSRMQLSRSYWLSYFKMTFENLSSYETIIFLLPSERFNQLPLTQLVTTAYLSQLTNPTPIHRLSSLRLPTNV